LTDNFSIASPLEDGIRMPSYGDRKIKEALQVGGLLFGLA
jgi:hypothetical protein